MDILVPAVNEWISFILLPLGIWILLSSLDDLIVDIAAVLAHFCSRGEPLPTAQDFDLHPRKLVAIFTPLWRESAVIGGLVQQNSRSILYDSYHVFIGAYPNDPDTVFVVRQLEQQFEHVHLVQCPHDGPTSKADCLNWIYQGMLAYESRRGVRFEVIVTHDAEDVIHPDSLHWINYYSTNHDMVQVPVLPIATPLRKWTHGLYCDEFTEYQARDMPARQHMGAFIPSNGVGAGFRRDALENLAAAENNRIFEPACLTEDYESGLRLHMSGARQSFLRVQARGIATREFFPQTFRAAVRQRTRWVTGIALQTWDRHGWKGSAVQKYWLWRDRKGLIGNPVSLLTSALCLYSCFAWSAGHPVAWSTLFAINGGFSAYRMICRVVLVRGTYGWKLAAGVPLRTLYGNVINSGATLAALLQFTRSKMLGHPLRWLKTEHSPSQLAFVKDGRPLGEILVMNGYIEQWQLDEARLHRAPGLRTGESLIQLGYLTEDDLYEALSLQQGLPQSWIEPGQVPLRVARALPVEVMRQWSIVPFRVELGNLMIASSEPPSFEAEKSLRRYTALGIRFHLVTPSNYRELAEAVL